MEGSSLLLRQPTCTLLSLSCTRMPLTNQNAITSNYITRVNVFTRQSKRWGDAITLSTEGSSWEKRGTITGALNLVTGDASQACAGSEVQ